MLLKNKEIIENALESKDIELLRPLLIPHNRIQNHSSLWRSALMLSTHNLKHLLKISTLNAECIMLNLEDGVSTEQKPFALRLCALTLLSHPQSEKKFIVRVNPLDEGGIEEIAYLNPFMPDGIRIPKIRSVADVERALELIDENIEVHLSIETKEAWLGLSSLATHPRVKAYYLGVLDLFADLGLSHSLLLPDNPALQYILSHFLITSHACGVKAVSFVYQDYKNSEGLRHWLELEKMIGFDAKGCISPNQAELIHEIFGHTLSEVEKYYEIIRLFEEHIALGISGFSDERFGFIDEPIYKGALAVVKTLV